jgi:hypothetical protein
MQQINKRREKTKNLKLKKITSSGAVELQSYLF